MRQTVLIVEDTELDRELLVQIFEGLYDIRLAADGVTACELASSEPPDLILMDIGLPGLSGLDAVRAIRATGTTVPIIAVSSRVMPGDSGACARRRLRRLHGQADRRPRAGRDGRRSRAAMIDRSDLPADGPRAS